MKIMKFTEPMHIEPLNLMVKALYIARQENPIYCANPKKAIRLYR